MFIKPSLFQDAKEAKRKGGKTGLCLTEDEIKKWNEISLTVQKEICKYKLDTDEDVRKDIIKSENKILIHPALRCKEEKVKDLIWQGKAISKENGEISIIGGNKLGECWMELRKKLE